MSANGHSPATPTTPKQVICIKWGGTYGPEYVNILYAMVARNVTGAFKLFCFTDNPDGIRSEVVCLPLPELGCEIPPEIPGKWRKQALWAESLPGGVSGTVLFVDLDSVITGNIDGYFDYGSPDDVIVARNWVKPLQRLGQTSIFRFKVGAHAYMLERLRADPCGVARKWQFEQHYVTHGVRGGVKFWPAAWTRHFRVHCLPVWPLRYFVEPWLPADARVVTFPGGPNPREVVTGAWHPGGEHRTPWRHIRHVWSRRNEPGFKWFREMKRYTLPPKWLAEHWRE